MKTFALVLAALMFCNSAFAVMVKGRVIGVSDGDTITVLDSSKKTLKIRLAGIDAPEKAQPFGQRSKQSLSGMVYGKEVAVLFDERDRYGRIVGKVVLPDGDVNLAQIRAGMAWHYKRYSNDKTYAAAEDMAKREGRGLWADRNPTPPWDWRRAN